MPLEQDELMILEQRWQYMGSLYYEKLKKLETRLPKQLYKWLSSNGFRNFWLQPLDFSNVSVNKENIRLIFENEKESWQLSFDEVITLDISQQCGNPIDEFHLNSLICEELIAIDERHMMLEMLLGSGKKIKIHFADDNIQLTKLNKG